MGARRSRSTPPPARRSTRPARSARRSACPSTCATRSGASTRRRSAPRDAAGGLIVAGHGRLVGRRAARGRRARPAAAAPARARDGLRHPVVDRPRDARAVLELLRRTEETLATYDAAKEAGAPRIVATTGGPLAERARADGVPVVPLPGGFQPRAAVGYSLVTALEAAALCGAAPSLRGEVEARRRAGGGARARVGARRRGGRRREADRALAARHDPGDHRRGADRVGRVPLEVPDQRERRDPGVREQAARARPQRDRRLGRAPSGASSAVFLEDPQADERVAAPHRRHGRRSRPRARRSWSASSARGETRLERLVSLVLLGDLVSLYMAVLRGVDPVSVRAIDVLKERLAAARA